MSALSAVAVCRGEAVKVEVVMPSMCAGGTGTHRLFARRCTSTSGSSVWGCSRTVTPLASRSKTRGLRRSPGPRLLCHGRSAFRQQPDRCRLKTSRQHTGGRSHGGSLFDQCGAVKSSIVRYKWSPALKYKNGLSAQTANTLAIGPFIDIPDPRDTKYDRWLRQ